MLRQRIKSKETPVADLVARVLSVLLAIGLIWYGAMLVLLAFKVAPDTVNAISGYRDAYTYLAGLTAGDIDGTTRLIAAIVGAVCAGLFGYLAWRSLPRPHLARTTLSLRDEPDGKTEVNPRAIERATELAATEGRSITAARSRYGDDQLTIDVGIHRATVSLATELEQVQSRARRAMAQHDLPELPVNVTLTRFDRQTRRELS